MGRAGIEPATLGLKVRLYELQRTARDRNMLHEAGFDYATSCNEMQVMETSLYAHSYARAFTMRATGQSRERAGAARSHQSGRSSCSRSHSSVRAAISTWPPDPTQKLHSFWVARL